MEDHYRLSDSVFEKQFAERTLNPALFTHEAHLRLAWIHISKYGIETAIANVTQQIKAYAESLGANGKYNKTVTIAALRAVYHFMLRGEIHTFREFIAQHQRLKLNFRELINTHYSTNIFTDARAKISYLEPELLPFD